MDINGINSTIERSAKNATFKYTRIMYKDIVAYLRHARIVISKHVPAITQQ
jgi:hypothetical protein